MSYKEKVTKLAIISRIIYEQMRLSKHVEGRYSEIQRDDFVWHFTSEFFNHGNHLAGKGLLGIKIITTK